MNQLLRKDFRLKSDKMTMRHTHMFLSVVFGIIACLSSITDGDEITSRIFQLEGIGQIEYMFYADDESGRITASDEVVTPHIIWANGLADGPLNILAIAHKEQGRWPIELSQRFDFNVKTIYAFDPDTLGAPAGGSHQGLIAQRPDDIAALLLQALNEPVDVIISDVSFNILTPRLQQRILECIDNGVGYVGPTEGMPIDTYQPQPRVIQQIVAETVPFTGLQALQQFTSADDVAANIATFWQNPDNHRIAEISAYPRFADRPSPDRLQYLDQLDMEEEAYFAFFGRAVLWAAGRLEDSAEWNVDWPTESVNRANLPCRLPFCCIVPDTAVELKIWDADGRLRYQGSCAQLPVLPAGDYFAALFLLQAPSQYYDWRLAHINITADVTIASIELDSIYKNPGQSIQADITLSAPPPDHAVLCCEVIDNFGRSIYREFIPAQQHVTWSGQFEHSLHIYNYVNVKLISNAGDVLDESRHSFYIAQPGPPRDDLNWYVWGASTGFHPRRRNVLHAFTRLGMCGTVTGPNLGLEVEAAAMDNIHPAPWAFNPPRLTVDDAGQTSPRYASQSYQSETLVDIAERAQRNTALSPLLYYLGDDIRYTPRGVDAGWSDDFRALLAQWTQQHYDSIEQLNQAWGTFYSDFSQVEPIRREEVLAAAEQGDYAPLCHWVEYQTCADTMIADWWRLMAETTHEVAPNVPANMGSCTVGWTWPGSGIDFWRLAQGKDLVNQYPNPWIHEIFRSAANPDALHGTWYGGYSLYCIPPYYDQQFFPWWALFHGINLHGLYYGGQDSHWSAERLLAPDLTPIDGSRHIFEQLHQLQGGIAKLLLNAQRPSDHISIVYSPSSLHASLLFTDGLPKPAAWNSLSTGADCFIYMQSWEALYYIARDTGFSIDVIHESQLEDARLLQSDTRVLILPLQLCLTANQADCIRRFVENGGTVIADSMCGMLDDQYRPNYPGMLADVLGVSFQPQTSQTRFEMQNVFANPDQSILNVMAVDNSVTLDTAESLAQAENNTPVFCVNNYGEGRALFFNALSRDYQLWRTSATEMPWRDRVAAFLDEQVDLRPAVGCELNTFGQEDGTHRIQVTEFNRYELDGAQYVGILRHHKLRTDESITMADLRPKTVRLTFDQTAHIYDVRRGTYRGFTNSVEDVIYPARAELYALLPYEVRDLTLQADFQNPVINVQAQIVCDPEDIARSTHVFHYTLIDPQGRTHPELSGNVLAPNAQVELNLFLGYNALPGAWHLTMRDTATGITRHILVPIDTSAAH
ncbi:MAG: beta-galactosidase trimerization domain-containing protein [Sedimentisphaerales bacterium]|nr:beta-galactosidase trimerization domain-containing protein [Sedimentisphaerales bacterium]